MVAKLIALFAMCLVAVASASNFNSFSYSVADPYTGDFKNQIEARAGNNVQGQYSLLEADGTRRTVDYAAGAGGFNAVVRKDPALIAAAPLVAAPFVATPLAAPLSYGAPIARFGAFPHTAPLAAPFPYARHLF